MVSKDTANAFAGCFGIVFVLFAGLAVYWLYQYAVAGGGAAMSNLVSSVMMCGVLGIVIVGLRKTATPTNR